MLYEISLYNGVKDFNQDAMQRRIQTEAQNPGASADQYWQVGQLVALKDGGLLVLWRRRTAAV